MLERKTNELSQAEGDGALSSARHELAREAADMTPVLIMASWYADEHSEMLERIFEVCGQEASG